ncbi:MAG: M12 family metallo-peptidase [Candidatus Binatia bacterium]
MSRLKMMNLCPFGALAALALFVSPLAAQAAPTEVRASSAGLAASARNVGKGQGLTIRGLTLEGQGSASTLELERYDVWREGAIIEVDGQKVGIPDTRYFRGKVRGEEGSVAMVSVRSSGEVQGLVQKDGRTWLVGKGRNQRSLKSRKADEEPLAPFECGVEHSFSAAEKLGATDEAPATLSNTVLNSPYVANIAIETDYEYYARFGNTQNALDYMADIIGYSDLTYSREVNTDMQIGFARLWTTGAANDPWNATSDTSSALTELRNYWNANMTSVKRTVVQMLSGKGLGGGIAWLGVLCNNYSSPGNSYDYGLSASLGTNFIWDGDQSHNPSNIPWDIVVVQHEIGHNFNSPHAHDYCNIGGSALPIDNCWSGCQSGATVALPSCSSPTPHFTTGGGSGTIMSYCHQRSGGYGNIAMTFGENHTCGTLPGRQADRMTAHVVARAQSYPTCFAGSTCGNGVLDAGEQCDGINLNGGTCTNRGFAGGTLSCSSNCTFNTAQCTNCGNNVINAGEFCDGTALGGGTCTQQGCTGGGTLACNSTCSAYNKSGCLGCPACNGNNICDAGEDCNGCPSDCIGGSTSGAVCGNGKCEAGNGEDCLSCPSDCNGVQGGKPQSRYCCGDGAGSGPIPCSDSRCTAGGRTCTTVPSTPSSYCCGDDTCGGSENCSNCATDCAAASETCGNGKDDNCNGQVDCHDGACSSAPSCYCGSSGTSCTSNSQCCSGSCKTKGKNANTCN